MISVLRCFEAKTLVSGGLLPSVTEASIPICLAGVGMEAAHFPRDDSRSERLFPTVSPSLPVCRPIANAWRQLPVFHRKSFKHFRFLPDCPQRPNQHLSVDFLIPKNYFWAPSYPAAMLGTCSGIIGSRRNAVTGTDDVLEVWCSITPVHRGSCSPGQLLCFSRGFLSSRDSDG